MNTDELSSEDFFLAIVAGTTIAVFAIICAIFAAIFKAIAAVVSAIVSVMTSWWAIPIVGLLILVSPFLYRLAVQRRRSRQAQARLKRLQQEQEQKRQQQRQAARHKAAYQQAYNTFSFVLTRSPKEARAQLTKLSEQFPDRLRADPRLAGDYQRLLKTASGQLEDRLRSELGL